MRKWSTTCALATFIDVCLCLCVCVFVYVFVCQSLLGSLSVFSDPMLLLICVCDSTTLPFASLAPFVIVLVVVGCLLLSLLLLLPCVLSITIVIDKSYHQRHFIHFPLCCCCCTRHKKEHRQRGYKNQQQTHQHCVCACVDGWVKTRNNTNNNTNNKNKNNQNNHAKRPPAILQDLVVWPTSTLWNSPVDVLVWGLDGAALAVDAVLGVDDELPARAGESSKGRRARTHTGHART